MIVTPNYHISIDYQDNSAEDPRQNVYEGVKVLMAGGEVVRFETNDPAEDYKSAIRLTQLMQHIQPGVVFLSSCADHFTKDVAGYRWSDADLIEINPEDPPIRVAPEDRIHVSDLTLDERIALQTAMRQMCAARQAAYEQAKAFSALRPVFLAVDQGYRELCARCDVPTVAIHDQDHFLRERRATGEAMSTPSFGRKGYAA